MKKILFIVLYHTNEDPVLKNFKEVWEKKVFFLEQKSCKVLFLQCNNFVEKDYVISSNNMFITCFENYWDSLLKKTLAGLEFFIDSNYDLVFKCNISTFINIGPFLDYCDKLPDERYYIYDGVVGERENYFFCSGAGMLLNKNSCKLILENKELINTEWTDDIFFGFVLNKINSLNVNEGNLKRLDLLIPNLDINKSFVDKFTHIRVKVKKDNWDTIYFEKLFNLIY